jgi:hypothetical protein
VASQTRPLPRTTALSSTEVSLARSLSLSLPLSRLKDATVEAHKRRAAAPQPTSGTRGASPSTENPRWLRMSLWSLRWLETTGCFGAVAPASITAMATIR